MGQDDPTAVLFPVPTSCILRALHLPPAVASRPQHHTVGLGDLAAATLPADSDVVSFRGRDEEPGIGYPSGVFHRQSLLPNPNLAWYLLPKGHNSASFPPRLLCSTSLPPWLCAVSHLLQSTQWESRNTSAGLSRMPRISCFQGMPRPRLCSQISLFLNLCTRPSQPWATVQRNILAPQE